MNTHWRVFIFVNWDNNRESVRKTRRQRYREKDRETRRQRVREKEKDRKRKG